MNNNKQFSLSNRIKSFGYAIEGIAIFFKTQHNSWIHAFAAIVVIIAGFVFKVNSSEWCLLTFAIALVIVSEMMNTAIEFLTDIVSPGFNPQAKKVKDVAAGAVLITAIAAVVIGLIVFLPKIL